jgi:hypothetical protein
MGLIDAMTGAVREWSVLAHWARATSNGPLGFGGTSLGALTAQLAADRAHDWPHELRPDALFLITHCGHVGDAVRNVGDNRVQLKRNVRQESTHRFQRCGVWSLASLHKVAQPLAQRRVAHLTPQLRLCHCARIVRVELARRLAHQRHDVILVHQAAAAHEQPGAHAKRKQRPHALVGRRRRFVGVGRKEN